MGRLANEAAQGAASASGGGALALQMVVVINKYLPQRWQDCKRCRHDRYMDAQAKKFCPPKQTVLGRRSFRALTGEFMQVSLPFGEVLSVDEFMYYVTETTMEAFMAGTIT